MEQMVTHEIVLQVRSPVNIDPWKAPEVTIFQESLKKQVRIFEKHLERRGSILSSSLIQTPKPKDSILFLPGQNVSERFVSYNEGTDSIPHNNISSFVRQGVASCLPKLKKIAHGCRVNKLAEINTNNIATKWKYLGDSETAPGEFIVVVNKDEVEVISRHDYENATINTTKKTDHTCVDMTNDAETVDTEAIASTDDSISGDAYGSPTSSTPIFQDQYNSETEFLNASVESMWRTELGSNIWDRSISPMLQYGYSGQSVALNQFIHTLLFEGICGDSIVPRRGQLCIIRQRTFVIGKCFLCNATHPLQFTVQHPDKPLVSYAIGSFCGGKLRAVSQLLGFIMEQRENVDPLKFRTGLRSLELSCSIAAGFVDDDGDRVSHKKNNKRSRSEDSVSESSLIEDDEDSDYNPSHPEESIPATKKQFVHETAERELNGFVVSDDHVEMIEDSTDSGSITDKSEEDDEESAYDDSF